MKRTTGHRRRARCPLCHSVMDRTDKESPADLDPVGDPHECKCGVRAWTAISDVDGEPIVLSFVPNRPLGVTKVRS